MKFNGFQFLQQRPFVSALSLLGGMMILLASFINIPEGENPDDQFQENSKSLSVKDSLLNIIKESSLRRQENEKLLARFDQRTDYRYYNHAHSIRVMLREEKELLKAALATWQQSTDWKRDSVKIANQLYQQESLANQINKSIATLN